MAEGPRRVLYTIGHSNHTVEQFVALLKSHKVSVVADVRSAPYSRYCPHFDREELAAVLGQEGIGYVFLGKELGARPDDAACYEGGRVSFRRVAARQAFRDGLERLRAGMARHCIALMCAEKEPLECHRTILVCRHLDGADVGIEHILEDGTTEDHRAAGRRLAKMLKVERTLFEPNLTEQELVERAYDQQAERIACRVADREDEQ
jgi:uncharacterized protein (DUF488 family)